MKAHRYVRQLAQNELSEFETYPILVALSKLNLGPCHIDLGKLASKIIEDPKADEIDIDQFVKAQCEKVIDRTNPPWSNLRTLFCMDSAGSDDCLRDC